MTTKTKTTPTVIPSNEAIMFEQFLRALQSMQSQINEIRTNCALLQDDFGKRIDALEDNVNVLTRIEFNASETTTQVAETTPIDLAAIVRELRDLTPFVSETKSTPKQTTPDVFDLLTYGGIVSQSIADIEAAISTPISKAKWFLTTKIIHQCDHDLRAYTSAATRKASKAFRTANPETKLPAMSLEIIARFEKPGRSAAKFSPYTLAEFTTARAVYLAAL